VLDVGAGFGRHVFECARRGADVVALDYAADEVVQTRATLGGMVDAGEIDIDRFGSAARRRHPAAVRRRLVRRRDHLRGARAHPGRRRGDRRDGPGPQAGRPLRGDRAGLVPREVNWMLSDEYHAPKSEGGHVRIYSATELSAKLRTPASTCADITAPTHCTRRTGGSSAPSDPATTTTSR
jgi:hypothetical protein